MGKTRRRNPMAREVAKPNYRQRRVKDKRKQKLEELNNPEDWVWMCDKCGKDTGKCDCQEK